MFRFCIGSICTRIEIRVIDISECPPLVVFEPKVISNCLNSKQALSIIHSIVTLQKSIQKVLVILFYLFRTFFFTAATMLTIQQFRRPQTAKHVLQIIKSTAINRHSSCCHKKKEEKLSVTESKFWLDPVTWQRTRINTLR